MKADDKHRLANRRVTLFRAFLVILASLFIAWASAPKQAASFKVFMVNLTTETDTKEQCPYKYVIEVSMASFATTFMCELATDSDEQAAKDDEQSTQEILEQKTIAHWTAWICGYTALGLLGLLWTLFSQRRLARDQSRAYVIVDRCVVSAGPAFGDTDTDRIPFKISLRFKNSGKTPAFATTINARFALTTKQKMDASSIENEPTGTGILGPGTTRTVEQAFLSTEGTIPREMTLQEIRQRASKDETIFFKGTIRYTTLEERWELKFYLRLKDFSDISDGNIAENREIPTHSFLEHNELKLIG